MALTFIQIMLLASFAVTLAVGQILFKLTAQTIPPIQQLTDYIGVLTNGYLWAAGVLYAIAILLWVFILQQVPLSRAYAFAALGFVIVPIASTLLFGESLTIRFVIGSTFILVGVYLAGGAT